MIGALFFLLCLFMRLLVSPVMRPKKISTRTFSGYLGIFAQRTFWLLSAASALKLLFGGDGKTHGRSLRYRRRRSCHLGLLLDFQSFRVRLITLPLVTGVMGQPEVVNLSGQIEVELNLPLNELLQFF